MKIENENIEIEFITENENENKYNLIFIKNIFKKINEEREEILQKLEIIGCRKVKINLYDNKDIFIKSIERFYKKYEIPEYCRGTIQEGDIYFLINNQIENNTYRYELELRKIVHEYIHILYNENIAEDKERIVWLDEGIALNLSKERGKFIKERFPILKSEIQDINLNELSHEEGTFVTKEINGYDVSYLVVKYLLEILSEEEFNRLIRDNKRIYEIRKDSLATSKEILSIKIKIKAIIKRVQQ